MSKNIKQVYDAKPTTTIPDNALLYLGLSPYDSTSDSAIKSQDIFPATSSVTDGQLTAFNGTSGKKLKTGLITFNGDGGSATSSTGTFNTFTGAPGGCGATIRFDNASNNIIFQVTDNNGNIYFGALTGTLGSGQNNQIFGNESFDSNTFGGSHNTSLGGQSGTAYTGSESSNILIKNTGVVADSNAIRIGSPGSGNGQQNKCFIAGINNQNSSGFSSPLPIFVDSSNGQLGFGAAPTPVQFENIVYVATNGTDAAGNGTLSAPCATITGTHGALSQVTAPSAGNTWLIVDMRIGIITESNDLELLPFTVIQGNKSASFNCASISLAETVFGAIVSDCFSGFGGYYEIGFQAATQLQIIFSSFSPPNQIVIYLTDVEKVLFVNDTTLAGVTNSQDLTFKVVFRNFNTAGVNKNQILFSSNMTIQSGIYVEMYDSYVSITGISADGGGNGITNINLYNTYGITGFEGGSTEINLSSSHPTASVSFTIHSGQVRFEAQIVNDPPTGTSLFLAFASSADYGLASDNLANVLIEALNSSKYLSCEFSPSFYTPTAFSEIGFPVPATSLDAQLNGIDLKLGEISPTDGQTVIANFTIPTSTVITPTRTWIIDSSPAGAIVVTLPATPIKGESHRFINLNSSNQSTITANSGQTISGFLFKNTAGVANIDTINAITSVELRDPTANNQVIELLYNGAGWVPVYSIDFVAA